MAKRSSSDIFAQDYLLGVVPISLQCQRNFNTKFHLYFEKGLQIISRHQSPNSQIIKNQLVQFDTPQRVQPFRVQSQKNMEYQWSIYIKRVDISGDNQELIDSCKIDLKGEWTEFKNTRQNGFKKDIKFGKMKIEFSFFIVITLNSADLMEVVKRYFQNPFFFFNQNWKQAKQNRHRNSLLSQKQQESVQKSEKKAVIKGKQEEKRLKLQHLQSLIQVDTNLAEQVTPSFFPEYKESYFQPSQGKYDRILTSPQSDKNDPNHKLSVSDIEIGNQIEEKIHSSESGSGFFKNKDLFPKILEEDEDQTGLSIRLTTSQLLDDTGVPFVPSQKKRSTILVVIVVILLLLGFLFMKMRSKQDKKKISQPRQNRPRQNDAKKQAKQREKVKQKGSNRNKKRIKS